MPTILTVVIGSALGALLAAAILTLCACLVAGRGPFGRPIPPFSSDRRKD
jgi:hypothetical protein